MTKMYFLLKRYTMKKEIKLNALNKNKGGSIVFQIDFFTPQTSLLPLTHL